MPQVLNDRVQTSHDLFFDGGAKPRVPDKPLVVCLQQGDSMPTRLLAVFVTVLSSASLFAQAPETQKSQEPSNKRPKSIKVVGCVSPDAETAGHFTLADLTTGATTYKLTGKDVRRYLGQRVEVVGVEPKLKIIGGLTPSPNVAAQAGNMDPTRAAMAQQGSQGNVQPGNIMVPELRVTAVKGVAGACKPR